jgi:phosphoribosylaminoimidazolecarboxamide formyltransferase/IMP cyclohydrolase
MEDAERRRPTGIQLNLRQLDGGMLVQDADVDVDERETMEVVTQVAPTDAQWEDLLFAWRVSKHVKSNAIVLARDLATVGIGAGQMSRVDSVRLAIEKAQSPVEGSVLASDAFFPFSDGPEAAAAAGVTAIIQPGGSMRDGDVIEAADRAGLAMVFTRRRHFKH